MTNIAFKNEVDPDDGSEDDNISEEENLLTSYFSGPRIFTINDGGDKVSLLGVVVHETEDSFLVAIPSLLVKTGEVYKIISYGQSPYFRLLKGNVSIVSHLYDKFEKYYLPYVLENGPSIYPKLAQAIEEYKNSLSNANTEDADAYNHGQNHNQNIETPSYYYYPDGTKKLH